MINPKVQNRTLAANVIRLRVLFSNLPDSTRPKAGIHVTQYFSWQRLVLIIKLTQKNELHIAVAEAQLFSNLAGNITNALTVIGVIHAD